MKKSINWVSKLLLVAAVILATLDAVGAWHQYLSIIHSDNGNDVSQLATQYVVRDAATLVWQTAYLGALAALIEIADQIRWHLKNRI